MKKREKLLALLDTTTEWESIPAAFFTHFESGHHRGQAAIDKHLEYFRYTGMDFVKIQYEHVFPHIAAIQKPGDWGAMPLYGKDFYEAPLEIAAGLVKAAKPEALVLMTLYSPFMCAGHTTSDHLITEHLKENPAQVKKGLEIVTDSLMIFVKECVRLGIDGFYASTQGGEHHRFQDATLFTDYIKPHDLILHKAIEQSCLFNILHVCDYHGGYTDLAPFLDYPGHVVNCSLQLGTETITPKAISQMFSRPYMGGLERLGTIATGSHEDIAATVRDTLRTAPPQYILGADCTLPNGIDWDNIKAAISTAHAYQRA